MGVNGVFAGSPGWPSRAVERRDILLTPRHLETGGGSTQGNLDGDGNVGILDFLALLAAWGDCPDPPDPCPADPDDDEVVGVLDFLLLLANWTA